MRQEITQLAAAGKLNAAQLTYAGPSKPLEELYDTAADPHQIRNLAASPEHRGVLERMRRTHRQWVLETRDLGFLPEAEVWQRCAGRTPWQLAQDAGLYPLERILAAADLVGRGNQCVPRQIQLLQDQDAGVRYWAAVGLLAAGRDAAPASDALRRALADASPSVQVAAAAALAAIGDVDAALPILTRHLQGDQLDVALLAAERCNCWANRPGLPCRK